MTYLTYKFIHVVCIIVLFMTLGGLATQSPGTTSRKIFAAINGVFLVLIFVAGFGLIAKLKLPNPWPAWVWLKLVGWLLVGMAPKFSRSLGPVLTVVCYGLLGTLMAYLALYKPF